MINPGRALSSLAVLAALTLLNVQHLSAQTPATISGIVIDAITREPVANVAITILGSDITATSNSDGTYTLIGVPPGLIKVKAQTIGFHPITTPYYNIKPGGTEAVNFTLAPLTVALDPVEVIGERPEERQWAFGSNIMRSDQLPTQGSVLEALSGTVAGLDFYGDKDTEGVSARNSMRPMLFVIDGVVVRPPIQFYIDVNEVECVEVRKGFRASQEFRPSIIGETYSGVILIWTRGSAAPRPRECSQQPRPGGGN